MANTKKPAPQSKKAASSMATSKPSISRKRSLAAKKGALTRARNRAAFLAQKSLHKKLIGTGVVLAALTLVYVGGMSIINSFAASTPVSATSIVGIARKCIDIDHGQMRNESKVQLYRCNNSNAQKWIMYSDGTIRNQGYCLDVKGGSTLTDTRVQLYRCNGTNAQKFAFVRGGNIMSIATQLCLTVKNGTTSNGAQLIMKYCRKITTPTTGSGSTGTSGGSTGSTGGTTTPSQTWTPPATTDPTTPTGTGTTTPVAGSGGTVPGTVTSGQKLYVSPNGNDSNNGTTEALAVKTLSKAQTLARSYSGNLTIYLAGGTYTETSPLALTSLDSGRNGTVTWSALPGSSYPTISGGAQITGWTQGANNIWSAKVPAGTNFRELYVNGTWAPRAKGASAAGLTLTSTGVTVPSNVAAYGHATDMEIVANNQWKVFRCGVASVSGTTLVPDSKCWSNAHLTTYGIRTLMYLENAKELLDTPGEWYLDSSASTVYYMPRSGETMNTTTVIYPIAQQLLTTNGLSNVTFSGIRFSDAGYNATSSTTGYTSSQAASYQTGSGLAIMPAAVQLTASSNISFTGNVFRNIGSAALMMNGGAQSSSITGNSFHDIGSAAVQLGGISTQGAAASSQDTGLTVANNYINNIGIEYPDAAAIFAGYVANTKITHNEIASVPYSGISLGWGWGTNSFAKNNEVSYNYIHDFMQVLQDGGAIYTLSSQPGSTITGNYAKNAKYNNCLYPDQGSANMTWSNNVCQGIPQWLHIWTSSINNLTVSGNYADTSSVQQAGTNITMSNNTIINSGATFPSGAQAIMNAAGIPTASATVKTLQ